MIKVDDGVSIFAPFKKFEWILNNKNETFLNKTESLVAVWRNLAQCKFDTSDLQYIVQVIDWAKLHTLNIVLTGEWKKVKDQYQGSLLREVRATQNQLAKINSGFHSRCQKLQDVISNPWSHPTLEYLLRTQNAEIGSKEIEFFCAETTYLTSVRLKKLCESHCEDLALNLVRAFMKCYRVSQTENINLNATETQVWFIFDMYIALLYKFREHDTLIEMLKGLSAEEGLNLMKRFAKKRVAISKIWKHCHRIAILSSQLFISSTILKPIEEIGDVLKELIRTYISLNTTDAFLKEISDSIRSIIRLADTAAHIYTFCDVFQEQFQTKMKSFIIELYIRALTTDMNLLERQKSDNEKEKMTETTNRLAGGFTNLAEVLKADVSVSRECIMTAFSLQPTLERMRKIEHLAMLSGFEVLDTGQIWKCKLHPPVLPSDEIAWICNACGDYMCKPQLNVPLNTNIALNEALTEEKLGITQELCDDLVVLLSCPRYQVFSWLLDWPNLHRLCVMYLNDPERTKNLVTELKFLDIDYSIFASIKKEPLDEYAGIERGYEQFLDQEFNYDDPQLSNASEDAESKFRNSNSDSASEIQFAPYVPPKSDPTTLKSLRMFRPSLKRCGSNAETSVPEKVPKNAEMDIVFARATPCIEPSNSRQVHPSQSHSNFFESFPTQQIDPSMVQAYQEYNNDLPLSIMQKDPLFLSILGDNSNNPTSTNTPEKNEFAESLGLSPNFKPTPESNQESQTDQFTSGINRGGGFIDWSKFGPTLQPNFQLTRGEQLILDIVSQPLPPFANIANFNNPFDSTYYKTYPSKNSASTNGSFSTAPSTVIQSNTSSHTDSIPKNGQVATLQGVGGQVAAENGLTSQLMDSKLIHGNPNKSTTDIQTNHSECNSQRDIQDTNIARRIVPAEVRAATEKRIGERPNKFDVDCTKTTGASKIIRVHSLSHLTSKGHATDQQTTILGENQIEDQRSITAKFNRYSDKLGVMTEKNNELQNRYYSDSIDHDNQKILRNRDNEEKENEINDGVSSNKMSNNYKQTTFLNEQVSNEDPNSSDDRESVGSEGFTRIQSDKSDGERWDASHMKCYINKRKPMRDIKSNDRKQIASLMNFLSDEDKTIISIEDTEDGYADTLLDCDKECDSFFGVNPLRQNVLSKIDSFRERNRVSNSCKKGSFISKSFFHNIQPGPSNNEDKLKSLVDMPYIENNMKEKRQSFSPKEAKYESYPDTGSDSQIEPDSDDQYNRCYIELFKDNLLYDSSKGECKNIDEYLKKSFKTSSSPKQAKNPKKCCRVEKKKKSKTDKTGVNVEQNHKPKSDMPIKDIKIVLTKLSDDELKKYIRHSKGIPESVIERHSENYSSKDKNGSLKNESNRLIESGFLDRRAHKNSKSSEGRKITKNGSFRANDTNSMLGREGRKLRDYSRISVSKAEHSTKKSPSKLERSEKFRSSDNDALDNDEINEAEIDLELRRICSDESVYCHPGSEKDFGIFGDKEESLIPNSSTEKSSEINLLGNERFDNSSVNVSKERDKSLRDAEIDLEPRRICSDESIYCHPGSEKNFEGLPSDNEESFTTDATNDKSSTENSVPSNTKNYQRKGSSNNSSHVDKVSPYKIPKNNSKKFEIADSKFPNEEGNYRSNTNKNDKAKGQEGANTTIKDANLDRLSVNNNSYVRSVLANVPGLHDTELMRPANTNIILNVVQVAGGRNNTSVPVGNAQTSTQVTPHIQRIGQPRTEKPQNDQAENAEPAVTTTAPSIGSNVKPATTQPSTLINILSQQVIRPGQSNCLRTRPSPLINIVSHQIIRPSTQAVPKMTTSSAQTNEQVSQKIETSEPPSTSVATAKSVTATVKSVAGATTTPAPGTILQFICKSAALPKFQQAFGKTVYQTTSTEAVDATANTGENSAAPVEANKKTQVKSNSTVNIQPIQGSVIYTRHVPVGQAINLIPPGRQVFRIATSNPDQISLVKDSVIHSKMSALLTAALQGKKSSDTQGEGDANSDNTEKVTVTRPTLVQNARIVKPVIQIPSNVIRSSTTTQSNLSSTTLEQLREFDMVYKQIKERSNTGTTPSETSTQSEPETSPRGISVTYLNQGQKFTQLSPVVVVSSYCNLQPAASPALSVTSQGSSSPCVTPAPTPTLPKVSSKPSSKGKSLKNTSSHTSKASPIPKPQQKPQEDEHTTQRIFDILAEYAEQLRNSPDLNNKPAPRRRSNPPTNPSHNSKRKKNSGSKKPSVTGSGISESDLEDQRTIESEDSSCGVMQLSVKDDEQPQTQTTESNDSTTNARPLLLTESNTNPTTRNLIITDSSVGEALKLQNTAVLVPGNYIMPVSMVKGGQQIAVVSGGSKILATVPARTGPNMLLFQSFLNQNRKPGVPTVKYSTLQPISGITSQNLSGVSQSPVLLPQNTNNLSTVTLGQSLTLKKMKDSDNRVNTELLLAIAQPRDNASSTENPPPDSSTIVQNSNSIKLENSSSQTNSSSEKVFNYQKSTIATPIATPVISQASISKNGSEESSTPNQSSIITFNIGSENNKDGASKTAKRVQSVLVTACTPNGPMLSHTPPRYRKSSESTHINNDTNIKGGYLHNGEKQKEEPKHFQTATVYFPNKTKKVITNPARLDRELHQLCLQRKQAALERELRLQKSLSEECEDLGVDEPSTSDLFPEADLLFDSNHSPSFDQASQDVGKKISHQDIKDKSITLFSDDDNSSSLRTDFLFDSVQYQTDGELQYQQSRQITNGQGSTSNESASSCEDSTLLQSCASMSDVTLNSPISLEFADNPTHMNKYKFKYSNRKRAERHKQVETWTTGGEVSSSEETMCGELEKIAHSPKQCVIVRETHGSSCDEDEEFKVVRVAISKTDLAKDEESCEESHYDDDLDSPSGRGARRSVKKMCSCCNGAEEGNRKRPPSRPHTPAMHKKAFLNKKR